MSFMAWAWRSMTKTRLSLRTSELIQPKWLLAKSILCSNLIICSIVLTNVFWVSRLPIKIWSMITNKTFLIIIFNLIEFSNQSRKINSIWRDKIMVKLRKVSKICPILRSTATSNNQVKLKLCQGSRINRPLISLTLKPTMTNNFSSITKSRTFR